MVCHELLEGRLIRTGDLIGTVDGGASLYGFLFRVIGVLIPGKPDHIAIYLGPDGICAEAGPMGVNLFRFPGGKWNAALMRGQREIIDTLFGVCSPIDGRPDDAAEAAREAVRSFVLDQLGKPYNWNFGDPYREDKFYCSQLAYAAYQSAGIILRTPADARPHPVLPETIITPEEVWKAVGAAS